MDKARTSRRRQSTRTFSIKSNNIMESSLTNTKRATVAMKDTPTSDATKRPTASISQITRKRLRASPSASFKPPISQEWLFCEYCSYQSHRTDFFQIHMEKAHGEKQQQVINSVTKAKDQPTNKSALVFALSPSNSDGESCDDRQEKQNNLRLKIEKASNDDEHVDSISSHSEADSISAIKKARKTQQQTNIKEKALIELCSRQYLGPSAFNDFRQLVLDPEVDINYVDSKGLSPLLRLSHHHSKDSLFDCVQLMLKNRKDLDVNLRHGANLQQGKIGCFNALAKVCREFQGSNLCEIAQLLLQYGAQPDVTDINKDNALIVLCANYKNERLFDVVLLLLDTNQIDVNAVNSKGWTALFTLCYNYKGNNLIDIIRLLVDRGADVNKVDYCGWNCLLALTDSQKDRKDFVHILRLLVSKGIDVNAKDSRDSFTALHMLCSDKYKGDQLIEIIQIFLDGGANLEIASGVKQSLGWKAIHFLCWNNVQVHHFLDICRLFIQKGFQLNNRDEHGRTLFHFVCKGKMRDSQVQIILNLLQLVDEGVEIDVTAKDSSGRKAVDYLRKQKYINSKVKRNLREFLI